MLGPMPCKQLIGSPMFWFKRYGGGKVMCPDTSFFLRKITLEIDIPNSGRTLADDKRIHIIIDLGASKFGWPFF
ncbi:hypothetical protein RRG08_054942 [Elysia crispata]|uniref:Uncharacterized protein n=1 Tax=Elysia crispata TaxID=231223 RepID=A0AAE0YZQ7_9GAST|nr:hypothetical protein RRG08_054942 [Elysia crispata]